MEKFDYGAFANAFMVCQSTPEGNYSVLLKFPTLSEAQKAHTELGWLLHNKPVCNAQKTQQTKFESWALLGSEPYDISKLENGCYVNGDTQNAWYGWQGLSVAYSKLEAQLEKMANYMEYLPGLLELGQMTGHAGNCTMLAKQARVILASKKGA